MSIFASAIPSLSIAQKLAIIPLVPNRHLIRSDTPFPFLTEKPILFLSIAPVATNNAKKFLKNVFCIVGRSPDILTKNVMREKKSAAVSRCSIAFLSLLPDTGSSCAVLCFISVLLFDLVFIVSDDNTNISSDSDTFCSSLIGEKYMCLCCFHKPEIFYFFLLT